MTKQQIARPTVPTRDLRVGDRLLVLRGEVEDVIPAFPLVTGVMTDDTGVVVALAERPDRPLLLPENSRVTVERGGPSE